MAEPFDPRQPDNRPENADTTADFVTGNSRRERGTSMTVDINLADRTEQTHDQPPILWRELVALLLLVILSDLTIYRSAGFAGPAALCVFGPLLIWFGAMQRTWTSGACGIAVLLLLTSAKLLWCGSGLLMIGGLTLLFAFAMSLTGQVPYVLETLLFAAQTLGAGTRGLGFYGERFRDRSDSTRGTPWLSITMPIAALIVFGSIFVLANPNLVAAFSAQLKDIVGSLKAWLHGFSMWEIVFCGFSLWVSVGLLRPMVSRLTAKDEVVEQADVAESPLYAPFRNTLLTVIGLFAVYLAFEFRTLWFREFPEGFYYSGYAHEGAAWLTLALGLATLVLSLIFRGPTLGDPRLALLKKVAWLWSMQNALLAMTVYHRLCIYIGFNGMTRMRVVGLLGISCVVIGFALVVGKIVHKRRFIWLVRRQLWTVAAAMFVYALLPIDMLVHTYNVRRILAGDPAPAVQISVHPITNDGYLVLTPLLESENEIIREGVRAMLSEQMETIEQTSSEQISLGWTAYQMSDHQLLDRLQALEPQLNSPDGGSWREDALERFHEYTYQWY